MKYNAAVACLMEFSNEAIKESCMERSVVVDLAKMLAVFAPFIAEEIYSMKGGKGTVLNAGFPGGYDKYLESASIDLPVQINGKMRGIVSVPKGLESDALLNVLKENDRFRSILEKPVKKVILVKDKILNIIM